MRSPARCSAAAEASWRPAPTRRARSSPARPPVQAMTPPRPSTPSGGSHAVGPGARRKAAAKEQEDFQRLKRRIDKLVDQARPQGPRGDAGPPARARGPAADRQRLLRLRQGRAQARRAGACSTARRRHPRRARPTRSSSRATPTTLPIRRAVPQQLGAVRRARRQRRARSSSATVCRSGACAAGYAAQHPVASNATAPGRSRNRRVEVVLTRIHTDAAGTRS